MFSAKNYGLPKDLIEAAKRVHEKQLEKDSHGKMPSKEHVMKMLKDGMSETEMMKMHSDVDKGKLKKLVKDCKEEMNEERSSDRKVYNIKGAGRFSQPLIDPEVPNILKDLKKREDENSAKQKAPPLPEKNPIRKSIRKPKNEEVQFTEEELAEAFAIFLEENFHVEMLTEEDLDYVFENEFPQWLEESLNQAIAARPERTGKSAQEAAKRLKKPVISQSSQDAHVGLTKAARQDKKGISSRKNILKANPPTTKTDQTTREGRPVTSGGTLPSSVVQGDTEGGYTSAPKPDVRKQVSRSRPAPSARRQTGAPKGSFTAYRKRLGLGGDLKSAQSERYKKAYRTYRAAKYPKKDNWRSSVFNPEN